jgi:hypothetical protein
MNHESVSQNSYSPGAVQDGEVLLRALFHPQHIVDGQLLAPAIPLTDLRMRGFSIERLNYTRRVKLEDIICQQMVKMPREREECTIARFLCTKVREIKDVYGDRAFLVIDTARRCHISHASVYAMKPQKESYVRKLRSLLIPLLQNRMTIDAIFATE